MNIRALTAREGSGVVVRWTLHGEYDMDYGDSVRVPDDARLIDIAFYGNDQFTQQIVFEPDWPGMLP